MERKRKKREAIMGRMHCPHPDCDHIGDLITKVHCRMHHGMERDELFEKYGKPEGVYMNSKAVSNNRRIKTIYQDNPPTLGKGGGKPRI